LRTYGNCRAGLVSFTRAGDDRYLGLGRPACRATLKTGAEVSVSAHDFRNRLDYHPASAYLD